MPGIGAVAQIMADVATAVGAKAAAKRVAATEMVATVVVVVVVVAQQVARQGRGRHDDARGLGGALQDVVLVDGDEEALGQIGHRSANIGGDLGCHSRRLDGELKKTVAPRDESVGGGADGLSARADE